MTYYNARKNAVTRVICAIIAVVAGVVATLVSYFLLGESNETIKVLKAIGIGSVAFLVIMGICYSIFTLRFKRRVFAFVSTACTWTGVMILLLILGVLWWVVLILAVALFLVCTLVLMGAYSEQLTVIPDNAQPDYKDYKTRQAEKQAQKQNEKKEELPEIKSFE